MRSRNFIRQRRITSDPSSGYRPPKDDWPAVADAQKGWAYANTLTPEQRRRLVPCAVHLNIAIDAMQRGYRIEISQKNNPAARPTVRKLYDKAKEEFASCPSDVMVSSATPGNPAGGDPGGRGPGGTPTEGGPPGGRPLPSPARPSPGPPPRTDPTKPAPPNAPASPCSFTLVSKNNLPRNHPIWSGPWWPDDPGRNQPHLYWKTGTYYQDGFGPLAKFDLWTGTQYTTWEFDNHRLTSDKTSGWQGHCDGWSVSSVLYREPFRAVVARNRANSKEVRFEFYDVKGLLAALWNGFYWDKNAAGGLETKAELHALDFHKFLLFYIKENNEALVINLTKFFGQVWNYPCDGFTMTGTPDEKKPGTCKITVKLDCADDFVTADFLGPPKRYGDPTTTVSYGYSGKNPQSSNDPGSSADWDDPELHPWWAFCPIYNTSGSPIPPARTNFRHHPYADPSFRKLVEGLHQVASGESNSWSFGDLSVTVAASKASSPPPRRSR